VRTEHFPAQVKEVAKRRADWKCEKCGKTDDEVRQLEVHHILAVWFAKEYFSQIASHALNSLLNAQVLCSECHHKLHRNEGRNKRIYERQAKRLEQIQPNLDFGL
jgi:hypothetical protein